MECGVVLKMYEKNLEIIFKQKQSECKEYPKVHMFFFFITRMIALLGLHFRTLITQTVTIHQKLMDVTLASVETLCFNIFLQILQRVIFQIPLKVPLLLMFFT